MTFLHPQPLPPATTALVWSWIGANSLLLAAAIRTCWPRPGLASEPWFALALPCRLSWVATVGPDAAEAIPQAMDADLEAISEAGVELKLNGPGQLPSDGRLQLLLSGLPPLPLRLAAESRPGWLGLGLGGLGGMTGGDGGSTRGTRAIRRVGGLWEGLSPPQRVRLQMFLYCRPGVWPERRAPLEPLGLLVVFARLLVGCRRETWFRRSLIEQAAGERQAAG